MAGYRRITTHRKQEREEKLNSSSNGFEKYLEVSHDETSAEVDEISNDARNEPINKNYERLFNLSSMNIQQNNAAAAASSFDISAEVSFDKERVELTENFENEKSDIVKGFILEKKVLNREHEKEKQGLISNFVQERQKMLESFQQQVQDIEQKMSSNDNESVFNVTNESRTKTTAATKDIRSPQAGKLLIRVGGDRILTPEQFLSAMELEEKFESEKELIEKSYRKEKSKLREKLEVEYERKYLREKQSHDAELMGLHKEIDKLKNLKHEVTDMWKHQACKLEAEFFRERSALEKHFAEEKENLRKKLEERNLHKLNQQQDDYDRMIRELKNELRNIKNDVSRHDDNATTGSGPSNHQTTSQIRKEIESQYRLTFDNETRLIRNQNEKLNADIQALTTEKYELNRRIRDLEQHKTDESKIVKEYAEKLNKEYSEKMRRLATQNEKLKAQTAVKEKELAQLQAQMKNQENSGKKFESRLELTERTITQYEDTVTSMRRENSNLSHEINLLRKEKEELSRIITEQNEHDRMAKVDQKQTNEDLKEATKKYAMLEREKLQQDRTIANLKRELEKASNIYNEINVKITAHEKETERLRNLVEGERKENKRLHERFKNDAELLRKKDNENQAIRTQLDNIKTQFHTLKSKIESDNDKIFKMESERQMMEKHLHKLKSADAVSKKHDLLQIQNKYVKEFSKRLEYVKANYEREIFKLKETIEDLQEAPQSEPISLQCFPPTTATKKTVPNCRKCCGGNGFPFESRQSINQVPISANNIPNSNYALIQLQENLEGVDEKFHENYRKTMEVLNQPYKQQEQHTVEKQINKTNQNITQNTSHYNAQEEITRTNICKEKTTQVS